MLYSEPHIKGYLFFFFLSLYILTGQGSIQSSDGMIMFSLTKAIVEKGALKIDNRENRVSGLPETGYSKYGIGMSVLAIPFYLVGKILSLVLGIPRELATSFSVSMINSIVTSLTCVVVFLFARNRFLFTIRVSLFLSFAYGLSTIAWVYSEDFMSEPITSLFLLSAIYFVAGQDKGEKKLNYIIAGVIMGMALTCRIASVITLPLFIIYFITLTKKPWRLDKLNILKDMVYFLAPIILFVLAISGYNYLRYQTFIETGYEVIFSTNIFTGLYGLLLSPGKSLFLYNPILLLGLGGMALLFRKKWEIGLFFVLIVLSHIFLYAFWHSWMGGWSWGPRFLLVIIPYLLLPVGYVISQDLWNVKTLAGVLFAMGIFFQIPAVMVNFSRYYYHIVDQYPKDGMSKLLFSPAHSPLIGQFKENIIVFKNLGDKEFVENLAKLSREKKNFKGSSYRDVLEGGLAVNSPNFWWYYMLVLGYSKYLVFTPIVLLTASIFYCNIKIYGITLSIVK